MKSRRASLLARLPLALAASLTLALPTLAATEARAEVTQPDRCREDLASSSRLYLQRVLKARIRCQSKIIRGKLSPAVDCTTGLGDAGLERTLRRAQDRLSNSGKQCNGVNLQLLGFPGACPDNTGFPFDTQDFQECTVDRTEVINAALLKAYYPPDLGRLRGPEAVCVKGTPKDASRALFRKMRTREYCLVGQDFGFVDLDVDCYAKILPYGPGTGDGKIDRKLSRAYVSLLGTVPVACGEVQIDDMGYEGNCFDDTGGIFTIFDLKKCLFDADRLGTLEALATVFPAEGICGDGVVSGDEECDDGFDGNSDTEPDACRTDCTNPICHDGVHDPGFGEECDDGNTIDGDCCSGECMLDPCGDGIVTCDEECDDGPDNSDFLPDACRTDCRDHRCGDGVEDTGEQCDDGNTVNDDGCSSLCFEEFCGDNIVQSGGTLMEECDDGVDNADEPNQCRTDCKNPFCGDMIVDDADPYNETCDDGNDILGDGCDNCAECGDGVVSGDEECDTDGSVCGPGEGCDSSCTCQPACPSTGELVLYAGYGVTCTDNADCVVGTCEDGRCRTATRLDSGWVGLAHDSDINDGVTTRGFLDCPGNGPTCGECTIVGIDPSPGNCRCANNTRTICDQPFEADADDCGGAVCNCYFGAPFPLASGGTPACVFNRFTEAPTGTANVDLGAGEITAKLRTQVHLGLGTRFPCPTCGGTCSDEPTKFCDRDEDCTAGTCNLDPVADDGVRGGRCSDYNGLDSGLPCDVNGYNSSFPAYPSGPNGGFYSLDCLPNNNVSGQGLIINLTQTTGTSMLESKVSCQGNSPQLACACLTCSSDPTFPCNTDEECSVLPGSCSKSTATECTTNAACLGVDVGPCSQGIGRCDKARTSEFSCTTNADCLNRDVGVCNPSTCSAKGSGAFPLPNQCTDLLCSDIGDGIGECTDGPDARFCSGVVKANGKGILACQNDDSCAPGSIGVDARPCALFERQGCFLEPIVATGDPDPSEPVGASTFCIPPTTNSAINDVAGLPGPGKILNQAKARTFCSNDTSKQYIPGVGGCLDPAPAPAAAKSGQGFSSSVSMMPSSGASTAK